MTTTYAPYGTRTIHRCSCGNIFNDQRDLFGHMHQADPEATFAHHNASYNQPISQREHDREQEEVEAYQRARIGRRG